MKDLNSLIEKLNTVCRQCLEEAAHLCVAKTHFTVDIEHFLFQLLQHPRTDLTEILPYYDIETKKAVDQLEQSLATFKRGNNKTPSLSPQLITLLERAWVTSSLHLKESHVRSGGLLMALLQTEELLGTLVNGCPELLKIPRNHLEKDISELIKESQETGKPSSHSSPLPSPSSSTPFLDQFTIDLIQHAAQGKIDPITGRDAEIRQMIDILSRRRQNNPILT